MIFIAASLPYAWLIIDWLPYWDRLEAAQGGAELQAQFHYTPTAAAAAMAAINASARTDAFAFYALDLLNAPLYALAIAAMIAFGLRRLKLDHTVARWMLALPFAAGVADLGENVALTAVLLADVDALAYPAAIASAFTTAKFSLGYAAQAPALLLGLAGLAAWTWRTLVNSRS